MVEESLRRRFWNKVVIADWFSCWEWTGAMSIKRGGYRRPVIWVCRGAEGKQLIVPAFRVALCIRDSTALWDHEGFEACHLPECDNEECVNPFHGYWGTPDDNRKDRYAYLPPRDRHIGGGGIDAVAVDRALVIRGRRSAAR